MTSSSSDIVLIPYEQAYVPGFEDMARRLPDLTKIERLIGYAPTKGIKDTIDEVIRFMRG